MIIKNKVTKEYLFIDCNYKIILINNIYLLIIIIKKKFNKSYPFIYYDN